MNPAILNVAHTGMTVTDVERSLAFWQQALGFELLFRFEVGGAFAEAATGVPGAHIDFAMVRGYGHDVELIQYLNPTDGEVIKPRPCDVGAWHLALYVNDIDNVVATMQAHGFNPVNPPVTIDVGPRKGGKAVYARDPDGTTIELLQPPPDSAETSSPSPS